MEQRKIHVLHIIGKRPIGGVGNVLLNYQTHMNQKEIQMDYLIFSDEPDGRFDNQVISLGSNVYIMPELRESKFFYFVYKLNNFFKKKKFDIIHVHSPNIAAICFYLAKKYGIHNRILHSHSTAYAAKKWNNFRNRILCFPLKWQATELMACSTEAGEFLFKGYKKSYQILNNAIDYKKYKYNLVNRKEVREQLQLKPDQFVIGTIGELVKDKNQIFLIHIFAAVLNKKPNASLLLVGSGELEGLLKKEANKLGVQDKVIFYGYSRNVESLLQAMDIFVMTSLNEGLPLVALEAQASGLPCLLSDKITKEVSVKRSFYLSLDSGEQEWASQIIEILENNKETREIEDKIFIEKGFAIEKEAEKLEKYYKKLYKSKERNIK